MIRIAVVGTGGISHAHIQAYLKFPDRCRIAALVDIVPGKAQRVKEQYGLDLDKRKIDLAEPIRTVGETDVVVKLYPEISAKLIVRVTGGEA